MQGTGVWSLVLKDPTWRGATKPSTTATEPAHPKAHASQQEKPLQWEAQEAQLDSSPRPAKLEKAYK